MVSSLRHFRQTNGVFPERVMIYRDGVGDGQLDVVRDQEIRNITAAFDQIGSGYRPKLTGTSILIMGFPCIHIIFVPKVQVLILLKKFTCRSCRSYGLTGIHSARATFSFRSEFFPSNVTFVKLFSQ